MKRESYQFDSRERKEQKKKKTESTTVSDSYMNTWCKLNYLITDTKITPKVYQ